MKNKKVVYVPIIILLLVLLFGYLIGDYSDKVNQSKVDCGVNNLKNISKCGAQPDARSLRKEAVYKYIDKKYSNNDDYENIKKSLVFLWNRFEDILEADDFENINTNDFSKAIDCTMYLDTNKSDIDFIETTVFYGDKKTANKYQEWNSFNSGKFFGGGENLDCNDWRTEIQKNYELNQKLLNNN